MHYRGRCPGALLVEVVHADLPGLDGGLNLGSRHAQEDVSIPGGVGKMRELTPEEKAQLEAKLGQAEPERASRRTARESEEGKEKAGIIIVVLAIVTIIALAVGRLFGFFGFLGSSGST